MGERPHVPRDMGPRTRRLQRTPLGAFIGRAQRLPTTSDIARTQSLASFRYYYFTNTMSRIQAQQNAQVIRAALPLLTLTLIGDRESYGYEIVQRLSRLGLEVSTGLVYPVLARLERDRLVKTRSVASNNGPPRKYFALTPDGQTARASARQQWQLVSSAVQTTLDTEGHPDDWYTPHE